MDKNNEKFNLNVSSKGEIYITGNFFGTIDFDPDINIEHNLTSLNINKIPDVFILKLTTDGNFNWVKRIGKGFIIFTIIQL
ncbi:MAG: hypothetical protein IPL95_18865 [Saprospiraceae bacterium]|nr:hypothetical protein [Saprospiraceae bacterium]